MHSGKNEKFLVCQQGPIGDEIGTLGQLFECCFWFWFGSHMRSSGLSNGPLRCNRGDKSEGNTKLDITGFMYPSFLKLADMSSLDFAIFKPLWLKSNVVETCGVRCGAGDGSVPPIFLKLGAHFLTQNHRLLS